MSVLWDTITEVASMQENCIAMRKSGRLGGYLLEYDFTKIRVVLVFR